MSAVIKQRSTHASRLERWFGAENLEAVSRSMRGARPEFRWYGNPIAVGGAPPGSRIVVGADGDFSGRIVGGVEACAREIWAGFMARVSAGVSGVSRGATAYAGFASLSDFIAQASNPANQRQIPFQKTGPATTIGACFSLWQSGGAPPAGAAGSAAPGGRACDVTTVGAMPFLNANSLQTLKFAAAYPNASVAGNGLLLFDRIFDVAKTASSSVAEAVSGVPGRYQNTTANADDSIIGNFLFMEVQSALAAVAHNWTPCTYTNEAGTAGQTLPSVTGISSAAAQRLDMPLGQWFAPLATGDKGVKALTNMQCSVNTVTGNLNFVMGHPIAWMPGPPVAGFQQFVDGVTAAFARIFDSACLSFLQTQISSATATNFAGTIMGVSS